MLLTQNWDSVIGHPCCTMLPSVRIIVLWRSYKNVCSECDHQQCDFPWYDI